MPHRKNILVIIILMQDNFFDVLGFPIFAFNNAYQPRQSQAGSEQCLSLTQLVMMHYINLEAAISVPSPDSASFILNQMKTIICNNKTISFSRLSGQVIDSSKHSETHVSSSGGGGYIGPNGGIITAPRVHSHTVTKHEFWLRSADGREHAIQLSNVDVPLRAGQDVSLIFATNEKSKLWKYTTLINHSADTQKFICHPSRLNSELQVDCITLTTIGKGLALFAFAGIAAQVAVSLFYVVMCGVGFLVFKKIFQTAKTTALLEVEMNRVNKLASEDGRARFHVNRIEKDPDSTDFMLSLIKKMAEKNSPLLVIEPRTPPSLQIDGAMAAISSESFTELHTASLARAAMTDEQYERFGTSKVVDFEISPEGLGRFHVRAASDGNGVKMSFTALAAT